MAIDSKLEEYLSKLDRSLGPIPVSERADIVTEIKSHVLGAQDRDPLQSLDSILSSLGEPEAVANRYILERGLKPGKPPRTPMIKWLTVGFLGTVGIFAFTFLILIFKFTPLVKVDGENDRLQLLGGVIDIDGKEGRFKVGNTRVHSDEKAKQFDGTRPMGPKEVLLVPFTNGQFKVLVADDNIMRWNCQVEGNFKDGGQIQSVNQVFKLDLEKADGVDCNLEVPKGVKTILAGSNGQIDVTEPQFDMEITVNNGDVSVDPKDKEEYRFETHVQNGQSDAFESSNAKKAYEITINVVNGRITKD